MTEGIDTWEADIPPMHVTQELLSQLDEAVRKWSRNKPRYVIDGNENEELTLPKTSIEIRGGDDRGAVVLTLASYTGELELTGNDEDHAETLYNSIKSIVTPNAKSLHYFTHSDGMLLLGGVLVGLILVFSGAHRLTLSFFAAGIWLLAELWVLRNRKLHYCHFVPQGSSPRPAD